MKPVGLYLGKQVVAKLYLSLSNERVGQSREQTGVIWSLEDQVCCLIMALFLRSTLSVIVLCQKELVLPQLIGNSASEALFFPTFLHGSMANASALGNLQTPT